MTLPINRVVRGDVCRVLSAWPDACIDLAIADPAYGFDKADWDVAADYNHDWLAEVRRVLKPSGTAYIFGPPETIARNWAAFPSPKRLLTWAVTNRVAPRCRTWQPTSESIVMLTKGKEPFFDLDAVREPYTESAERHRGRRRPPTSGRFGNKASKFSDAEGALPRDVLRGPGLSGKVGARESLGHPCQKPLWLMERLIKASCPPGVIVLDLFAGVATTSAAAHGLGRKWIAIENDSRWYQVAVGRLRAAGARDAAIVEAAGPDAVADLLAWKSSVDVELAQLREIVAKLTAPTGGFDLT